MSCAREGHWECIACIITLACYAYVLRMRPCAPPAELRLGAPLVGLGSNPAVEDHPLRHVARCRRRCRRRRRSAALPVAAKGGTAYDRYMCEV